MRRLLFVSTLIATGVAGLLILANFILPERSITWTAADFGDVDSFAQGSATTFSVTPDDTLRELDRRYIGRYAEPGERGRLGAAAMGLDGLPRCFELSPNDVVVHIVRFEDGSFRAFSGKSSHRGEMVWWISPDLLPLWAVPGVDLTGIPGYFLEPCHGESWAMDGTRIYGPAPRDLDYYSLEVSDGRVIVDLSDLTEGETPPPQFGPFPTSTPMLPR